MIITLIFLFIMIFLLFEYIVINCNTNQGNIFIALLTCIILSVLGGALVAIKFNTCEPTAMDVYKGKTSIEVIYRNNIPVDSVVVFKNK